MLLFYTFHWCRIFGAFKEGTRFLYSKNCNYLPGSGLCVAGWMALPLDESVLAEGTSALLWSINVVFDKLQGVSCRKRRKMALIPLQGCEGSLP